MAEFFRGYDFESLSKQSRKRLQNLRKYGLPSAEEYQRINEAITQRENALALQQLGQFAPQLTELGTQIAGQEQRGGMANDLAAIMGPGRELLTQSEELDRLINPQFYANRELGASGLQSLIGGMDPNRLTGSEMANVERGVNRLNQRRGNTNVGDATTTAANALQFDDRLQQKRQAFGQALNLIPGIQAASQSPLDAFGIATGKGNQPRTVGAGQTITGSNAGQLQGSNLNQLHQDYLQGQSARKTGSDVIEGAVGSCLSCYIFKEYYGYPDVPEYLRWVRDFEYRKNRRVDRGYRKMANWLVPLMRQHRIIRPLVAWTMVLPLTAHAAYRTGYNKWGRILLPFKWFWLKVWSL
jgi:hypothetical protein